MVAIIAAATMMLGFMPMPVPPMSTAAHSRTAVMPASHQSAIAAAPVAPRCPAVKAGPTTQQLEAVAVFLGVVGGLPFLLAQIFPPPKQRASPTRAFDENFLAENKLKEGVVTCLLYTSPSPRDS